MGPENIFLFKTSGDPSSNGTEKERKRRPLRPEYAEQLRRYCSSLEDLGTELFIPPIVKGRPLTARVPGYESDNISLAGYSANMASIVPRDFDAGRYFTPEEEARVMRVAIVGYNVAQSLFPGGDAVGKAMMVDGAEYIILGVLAKAKGGFFGENGMDNAITIPLRTAQVRYPQVDRYMIIAKAKPGMRQQAFDEVKGRDAQDPPPPAWSGR